MQDPSIVQENICQYPTLSIIRQKYADMPRGQQKIADYIMESPSEVVNSSISELAQRTSSKSESSIVRFYRSLGFDSYRSFRLTVAQEIASKNFFRSYEDIENNDTPHDIKRKIFNAAMLTINANAQIDNDDCYEKAFHMLLNAKRIILLGYAASAAVCCYAHFRFLELGLNCHFSSDAHINTAILTKPDPNDLLFCVSMSGETRDIIRPLENAKISGAKIIALTGNPESTLAKMADVTIHTSTDETTFIADAMNARLAQMCTVDALFSMISISGGSDTFTRLRLTRQAFRKMKINSDS